MVVGLTQNHKCQPHGDTESKVIGSYFIFQSSQKWRTVLTTNQYCPIFSFQDYVLFVQQNENSVMEYDSCSQVYLIYLH